MEGDVIGLFLTIICIIIIIGAFLKDRKCEIIARGAKWVTKGNPSELTRNIRNHI